jgi:P4 family phage/plasmid primase-like protien
MTAPLLDFHRDQLRASAISDAVIDARGYSTVGRPTAGDQRSRDLLRRLGFPLWARDADTRFPALLIPQYRATGEQISWQVRLNSPSLDEKTGKRRRYASVAGRASVIDVHPFHTAAIADPGVPLVLTEGIKKADALTTAGLCAAALSGVWNWRHQLATLGDWEDIPLKGRAVNIVYDADAAGNDHIKRAMSRLGRWLASKGAAQVSYVVTPGQVNGTQVKGCDDFLAAGGTLAGLWAAAADRPPPLSAPPELDPEGWMVEDLANDALDGRWCWSAGLGWLAYEPGVGRWRPLGNDKDTAVKEVIRRWMHERHIAAIAELDAAARAGAPAETVSKLGKLAGLWRAVCTNARITALATLARGLMARDATDFDAQPDLLNCPNGVLDLRTGQLAPHDPEYLFTTVTRAAYSPGARHSDWAKALEAIPADARDYLQLRYGQAATGHPPPDDIVLVQLGGGSNGKSSVVFACSGALGDGYARLIGARAVIADRSAHPTEKMDFRGARLAILEELPEDRILDAHRIKEITAMAITARHCGQDDVTFDVTHSLIISTNYDPVVTSTDHGTWRRLLALRYPYTFREGEEMPADPGEHDRMGDPGLRDRLRAGDDGRAEAVLAWLAEGAWRWYAGEVGVREPMTFGRKPSRIREDTTAWKAVSNPVFGWVAENLAPGPGWHVPSQELVQSVTSNMMAEGHNRISDQTARARLAAAFGELGWKAARVKINDKVKRTGRSQRAGSWPGVVTEQYWAWEGIRYRVGGDDDADGARDPTRPGEPAGDDLGSSGSSESGDFPDEIPTRCAPDGLEPLEPARSEAISAAAPGTLQSPPAAFIAARWDLLTATVATTGRQDGDSAGQSMKTANGASEGRPDHTLAVPGRPCARCGTTTVKHIPD